MYFLSSILTHSVILPTDPPTPAVRPPPAHPRGSHPSLVFLFFLRLPTPRDKVQEIGVDIHHCFVQFLRDLPSQVQLGQHCGQGIVLVDRDVVLIGDLHHLLSQMPHAGSYHHRRGRLAFIVFQGNGFFIQQIVKS